MLVSKAKTDTKNSFSPQKFYECMLALERNFPSGTGERALLESTFSSVGGIRGAQRRLMNEIGKVKQ